MDHRLVLTRDGLAAEALVGKVPARTYQPTRTLQVCAPVAPLRRSPRLSAEQDSQLLFGERFEVLTECDGFAFGQCQRDGYVGFVDLDLLTTDLSMPTHRVASLRTYGFTQPSIKSLPTGLYSLNALVRVEAIEDKLARVDGAGWLPVSHLAPIGQFDADPAAVAERFLGVPYLWGGVESLGLDCSGLVQQSLRACGRACPRDTDQQQSLGTPVEASESLKRNDLVFWRGHVGMMLDHVRLIHANGHHMAVTIESLEQVSARIMAAGYGPPMALRRP
jgi:hypothetical protein